jgi:hypothetical protein
MTTLLGEQTRFAAWGISKVPTCLSLCRSMPCSRTVTIAVLDRSLFHYSRASPILAFVQACRTMNEEDSKKLDPMAFFLTLRNAVSEKEQRGSRVVLCARATCGRGLPSLDARSGEQPDCPPLGGEEIFEAEERRTIQRCSLGLGHLGAPGLSTKI